MTVKRYRSPDPSTRQEIIDSAARAFFVDWWATDYEERKGRSPGGGGEDLMDIAPNTNRAAKKLAKQFIALFEEMNGASADVLFERAANTPGKHYKEPSAEDFGHYLAMQAIGHGVGWNDDHPKAGLSLPRAEFYGRDGSVSGRSGTHL